MNTVDLNRGFKSFIEKQPADRYHPPAGCFQKLQGGNPVLISGFHDNNSLIQDIFSNKKSPKRMVYSGIFLFLMIKYNKTALKTGGLSHDTIPEKKPVARGQQ